MKSQMKKSGVCHSFFCPILRPSAPLLGSIVPQAGLFWHENVT